MWCTKLLINFLISLCILRSSEGIIRIAYLKAAQVGSENPGFLTADCPISPDGYLYGWHFVLKETISRFLSINCTFDKAGIVTKMIQLPSNRHAFVFTSTSDTLLNAFAVVVGPYTEIVLRHICSPYMDAPPLSIARKYGGSTAKRATQRTPTALAPYYKIQRYTTLTTSLQIEPPPIRATPSYTTTPNYGAQFEAPLTAATTTSSKSEYSIQHTFWIS